MKTTKTIRTTKHVKTTSEKTRLLTLALAVTLAVSIAGSVSWADGSQYTDVKDTHWAWPAIQSMSQKGIIQGYPDGSFRPGEEVTYGEFIKMAVMATAAANEGASGDHAEDGFAENGNPKDNPAGGNWAEEYYQKALENSLFTTNNIAAHQLPHNIPRGDMALIVSTTMGDIPIERYSEITWKMQDLLTFGERDHHIVKSIEYGILTGYSDSTFKPENTLNRAEAAVAIHRLMKWQNQQADGESSRPSVLEGEDRQEEEPLNIIFFHVGKS